MRADFNSLNKLGDGLSYVQTAIAKVSGLLLMLGLVTASANLLMEDWLFGTFPWLQAAWAIDQALAVDANLALVFILLVSAVKERDWVKAGIYGVIGALLLVVAGAIMDLESVRQALNISLQKAALEVNVSVSFLTQLRSIVVVLLVAMSGLDGISLLAQKPQPAPTRQARKPTKKLKQSRVAGQQAFNEYMALHPEATNEEVARDTGLKSVMVRRYRKAVNGGPALSIHAPTS